MWGIVAIRKWWQKYITWDRGDEQTVGPWSSTSGWSVLRTDSQRQSTSETALSQHSYNGTHLPGYNRNSLNKSPKIVIYSRTINTILYYGSTYIQWNLSIVNSHGAQIFFCIWGCSPKRGEICSCRHMCLFPWVFFIFYDFFCFYRGTCISHSLPFFIHPLIQND